MSDSFDIPAGCTSGKAWCKILNESVSLTWAWGETVIKLDLSIKKQNNIFRPTTTDHLSGVTPKRQLWTRDREKLSSSVL